MHSIGKGCWCPCKELELPCDIVAGQNFLNLSSFLSLFFLICFLGLVKALEHDLFLCPLVNYFGFCFFGPDFGSFFLVFSFPFCCVFHLREFARVSTTTFLNRKIHTWNNMFFFHCTMCVSSKNLPFLWEKN
jgi:hypothetical protein